MAILLSTCLANRIAGQPVSVTDAGSQIAFVAATNTITTTENDFLTQGFRPGLAIEIENSSSNDMLCNIVSVASDGSSMVVDGSLSDEGAGAATPTITVKNGFSWLTTFRYSVLAVFSSPMPSSADVAETGTLLLKFTLNAGAHTPGTSTNGLEFEFNSAGQIKIKSGQTWQASGITDGTAYYARLYDNAYITGDDSSNLVSPRIQGRVGTSGQDFDITSTSIVSGVLNTCDVLNITVPLSS